MTKTFFGALVSIAAVLASGPALARPGVYVGRDANITVNQEGSNIVSAIGAGAVSRNRIGVIAGDVKIGRDATITVNQKGKNIVTALGALAKACNANGVITSDASC
jgi:hypothetical protein